MKKRERGTPVARWGAVLVAGTFFAGVFLLSKVVAAGKNGGAQWNASNILWGIFSSPEPQAPPHSGPKLCEGTEVSKPN
jgi:hypothetical protein